MNCRLMFVSVLVLVAVCSCHPSVPEVDEPKAVDSADNAKDLETAENIYLCIGFGCGGYQRGYYGGGYRSSGWGWQRPKYFYKGGYSRGWGWGK